MQRVSVPLRGFRGLQVDQTLHSRWPTSVSVPLRGFRGLQGREFDDAMAYMNRSFSPLAGF